MENPRNINEDVAGFNYLIPTYEVTNEGIFDGPRKSIEFCRGDKADDTKPRQAGVFVESLIEASVQRLKAVNVGELASRETAVAITKLEEAIMWLNKRTADRQIRGVEGTYKP